MITKKVKINGYWDGLPIWRMRTAREQFDYELNKPRPEEHDCHASPNDGCEGCPVQLDGE